jgi:hypothetical protein
MTGSTAMLHPGAGTPSPKISELDVAGALAH